MNNIFGSINHYQFDSNEIFEKLFSNEKVSIERIVSKSFKDKNAEWYDQENNEWVVLLEGEASLEFDNKEFKHLAKGDFLYIPAHQRHRVVKTTGNPYCIWLAIHINN